MKRNFVFAVTISLFVFMFSVSAQKKITNFGGTWTLDVSKSKLDERARIESMTMAVTQTKKDIKVETVTKRIPWPEHFMGGLATDQARGGYFGDAALTYSLKGKETKAQMDGPMGSTPVILKAKIDGGKLHLSRLSGFNTSIDEETTTTKEIWELSAGGKTLTVNTTRTTPRGTDSTTMVFAKKR